MPKLGVQMYTLRRYTQDEASLRDALTKIRDIGYCSIQVSAFGNIDPSFTASTCAELGLDIGGTHVAWDRFTGDIDNVIKEHELWQCRHSAIGMIQPKTYLSLKGLDAFLEELEPVANALATHDITFSYHNHAHEFLHFEGRPWFDHLLERSSPAMLKIELDTHWVVAGGGDPVEWIHRCGDRMPLLHLKDFAIDHQFKRNFAAVGDGNMNWSAILEAASQYEIDYYLIEQDDCYGEDEFDCLKRSYEYLRARGYD
jgi:sugar phosphate isomerase/epimerase